MDKPFHELSSKEAKAIVKEVVCSSQSEDQIRARLTEAGFNGAAAAITSTSSGPMFMAMVMVYGPRGEVIDA